MAMQLEWCKGDSLVKTVPADVDWGLLMRGGSNGLAIVIVALSWWVNATDAPNLDLSSAIDDVNWVLSELVTTLSSSTLPESTQPTSTQPTLTQPASTPLASTLPASMPASTLPSSVLSSMMQSSPAAKTSSKCPGDPSLNEPRPKR